jgi:ribosomal protein S18 acetylase RimI-like enzyme
MSMLKDYFKETLDLEFHENEYGFIAYKIVENNLHIQHMYVKPEARAMKVATMLADELVAKAKALGCVSMTGDVELENKVATSSMLFILSYGLELYEATEDEIVFFKFL